ncbi:MAG: hypothetical protein C0404_01800 [Verrucomicrobia bacterium]|nr:hypothetical protein [Verrucomicrobiota bacterium]
MSSWMLVIGGCLWLLFGAVMRPAITVAILRKHAANAQSQPTFTREEVASVIYDTGRDMDDHAPWILAPTLLMLIGFLIGRQKRSKCGVPNHTSDDIC